MLFYSKDTLTAVPATITWVVGDYRFTASASLAASLSRFSKFIFENQEVILRSICVYFCLFNH